MYECYDDIVGLTTLDCECLATGRPETYNISASGLYIDQLANISDLVSLAQANCNQNIWNVLSRSNTLAIQKVVAESNALLNKRHVLRRPIVKNQVLGEIKSKDTVSPSKNYAVVRINCCPIRGGIFKLNKLGTVFAATGTQEILLYDNVTGYLKTYTPNTVADVHTPLTIGDTFPLYSKYVAQLEYYLVFQFNVLNLPKDTDLTCGCSGWSPVFNSISPYYRNIQAYKAAPWANYVMIGGTQINSLTELDDLSSSANNSMYGLVLDLDFSCKVDEVICGESLDFVGNPLAMSLAFAVQYKWGVEIAEAVIKSTALSRETMVNREEWEDSIILWTEKYNEHINFIVDSVDHTANDCLTCKDLLGMTRQGLLA